jgi:hypothetical protein
MRRVFGPRTVVEAAFLVAVPVVAAAIGSGMWTIIAASAVAYLLIFVLEATLWREGRTAPSLPGLRLPARHVVVEQPEPQAQPADTVESVESVVVQRPAAPEPPAPEPQAVPEPAPPAPVPAPAPVAERPALAAVPELEPEPEPEPEPAPEPPPTAAPPAVVPIGVGAGPRQWNLWDLERLTREHAGSDPLHNEERQFLLLYLREFADGDGLLPVDFDGLVRESFGELVGAR